MSIVASRDREAARRLDIFRRFLTHISECILPDIGFVLWDGSTVPADLPADALAFIIADEMCRCGDDTATERRHLPQSLGYVTVRPPQRIFF